jgi:hypothetical protein
MRRGALQAKFVARWGEGADPASLLLIERFFASVPPFAGIAGLATGDFSSPSDLALRVRMRRAGVLDAWGADWTIALLKMECAACMQGVKLRDTGDASNCTLLQHSDDQIALVKTSRFFVFAPYVHASCIWSNLGR